VRTLDTLTSLGTILISSTTASRSRLARQGDLASEQLYSIFFTYSDFRGTFRSRTPSSICRLMQLLSIGDWVDLRGLLPFFRHGCTCQFLSSLKCLPRRSSDSTQLCASTRGRQIQSSTAGSGNSFARIGECEIMVAFRSRKHAIRDRWISWHS